MNNYFPVSETKCRCCDFDINQQTRDRFNLLREQFGQPLVVSGPARCPARNLIVTKKTDSQSQHMYGTALDISIVNFTLYDIIRLVALATQLQFKGIAVNEKQRFIHLDIRESEDLVFWRY